ncbi:MAG: hypothetical protein NTZ87_00165 [Candidatus Nomurabacteria bacterium]|nr:hypothetical protein [Candidatus Nomurabacteria bacterium]
MPPDNQNTIQNQDSEKNSIPSSPQGATEPVPEITPVSASVDMPPEAPESPKNADIPVSLNNDNPQNEPISTPSPEEAKPKELPAEGGKAEGISEPVQASETRTAQIPVNEPLTSEPEVKSEPLKTEPQTFSQPKISIARELLVKARNMIQFRKRKKLDRVMTLFLKKSKITNDEVREFLHVSDATAERYLNALEKESRIKQVGKTGHAVSYSRI